MNKNKFKLTEAGKIPEDWDVYKLSQMAFLNKPLESEFPKEFYYIDLGGVNKGVILDCKKYNRETAPSRAQRQIKYGDILFQNVRPYQQNNLFVDFKANNYIASTGYTVIRCFNQFNSRLVYYLIHKDEFLKQVLDNCTGTSYPAINQKGISKLYLGISRNIIEQDRIAKALSDIDSLLSSLQEVIEKKRNIKQGAMQELLSGKRRLKGFNDKWEEKCLSDISDLYQPQTIGGHLFTNYGYNVYGANGVIGKYPEYNHITDQILITCRGNTCGEINYSKGKCWINGNAMVANMDRYDVCKRFMYHYLKSQDFSFVISGSGQPQITRKPLQTFLICIPSKREEQESIAIILDDMDSEINALKERLEKYQALKQGMMQQLLTGKIRLI